MTQRATSRPFVLVGLALLVFLSVLTYFVNKSNNVKRAIITANAIEFNKSYAGATLHTTVGDIRIEFLHEDAPKTIFNFIELVEKRFYNGTKFHYVLRNFLIQGGDPLSRGTNKTLYGTGGPGYSLPSEKSPMLQMKQGIVAMANIGKDTSGSQFFIVTALELLALNGKFTAFARVIGGFDVLEKINNVPTDDNVPRYPIEVTSIEID
ncbi:MAG: peptidylprolyl isomerase [bacterium]|nr:peptidylprolyl isomerase [bacterium]